MVRPCGILRRDAIEARGDYLIARGSCRRRFVHSARARCLLAAGLIKSWSARPVCISVAVGNDHHRFDLRLSSHRATSTTPGFSYRGARHAVNNFSFNPDFNTDYAQRSRCPGAAHWTTDRRVSSGTIQSNLFLHRSQCIDYETDVFVDIDA